MDLSRTSHRLLLATALVVGALGFAIFTFRPAIHPPETRGVTKPRSSAPAKSTAIAAAAAVVAAAEPLPLPQPLPSSANPLAARDAGYRVISALQNTDAFSEAAGYAAAGPAAFRTDLLVAAYYEWGRRQPELALQSAVRLSDVAARETAVQSVWSGWARTDPAGLAETALTFPDGAEKNTALTKAIRAWMIHDPWKAGDWILAHDASVTAAETVFRTEQR